MNLHFYFFRFYYKIQLSLNIHKVFKLSLPILEIKMKAKTMYKILKTTKLSRIRQLQSHYQAFMIAFLVAATVLFLQFFQSVFREISVGASLVFSLVATLVLIFLVIIFGWNYATWSTLRDLKEDKKEKQKRDKALEDIKKYKNEF